LPDGEVVTRIFQLSPPTRFGHVHLPELERARNVTVLCRATVLEVVTTPTGDSVTDLLVGTLDGRRFRVEARAFVLAAGGVENARLLLLSDRHAPRGVGNDHDQVGRNFMEHLHFVHGMAVLRGQGAATQKLYSPLGHPKAVGRLFMTAEAQEKQAALQGNVMLSPSGRGRSDLSGRVRLAARRVRRRLSLPLAHTIEQPPEASNRVTLGDRLDAFGQRRLRLEWRVGEPEERTFRANLQAVKTSLEAAGIGTVVIPDEHRGNVWPPAELQGRRGHHMGTTRMSSDPSQGVVDANCRVHGVRNLFVAGSSVFPTGGAGTPTLTLVALAVRLADHLRAFDANRDV
jgi:choline dehydrogenase-like flavoprotein